MIDSSFEQRLRSCLENELPDRASALLGAYAQALEYLKANIYEEIRGTEVDLTDHGPRHVANVQRNILELLAHEEPDLQVLSASDFYCLAMSTLFHDVGNILGRIDHHQNIGGIFDAARGTDPATKREKTLVLRICGAHTGQASDGTHDTLKELNEIDHLDGKKVRLREIAAILRFADELAEGPQRTSAFRLQRDDYQVSSRVYQEYASVTHVLIDRGNGRILLAYEIPVDAGPNPIEKQESLETLFSHIFHRVTKLDQERRYATHYAPTLSPFKATVASFTFHCGDSILDYDLPKIVLNDLTVPGENVGSIENANPVYSPETLSEQLISLCQETKEQQ